MEALSMQGFFISYKLKIFRIFVCMMRWMKRVFQFSERELKGMRVLAVLVLISLYLPFLYRFFFAEQTSLNQRNVQEITAWMDQIKRSDSLKNDETESGRASRSRWEKNSMVGRDPRSVLGHSNPVNLERENQLEQISYFNFDPNTLDASGWKKLGFSNAQVQVIQNYLKRGGKFKERGDLKKVYSIRDEDYERVKEFIRIEKATNQVFVELNTADSLALLQLTGIGPAFASRILKYRTVLGGYVDKSQVLGVYGMDEERYGKFERQVWVDTTKITGVAINEWDAKRLGRHPYIGFKVGEIIVRYRHQHGPFKEVDEIRNLGVIEEENLKKLIKYLVF
jgi:competence protein ComEA